MAVYHLYRPWQISHTQGVIYSSSFSNASFRLSYCQMYSLWSYQTEDTSFPVLVTQSLIFQHSKTISDPHELQSLSLTLKHLTFLNYLTHITVIFPDSVIIIMHSLLFITINFWLFRAKVAARGRGHIEIVWRTCLVLEEYERDEGS